MDEPERKKTIEYLRLFIGKLEDRPDADELKESIDNLKASIRKLEESVGG